MINKRRKRKGQSLLEFIAVLMFILAIFLVFQKYIVRGFGGRWKGVGDTLGQGRIYDGRMTTECATNVFYPGQPQNIWYDARCFNTYCTQYCLGMAIQNPATMAATRAQCLACINGCSDPLCN